LFTFEGGANGERDKGKTADHYSGGGRTENGGSAFWTRHGETKWREESREQGGGGAQTGTKDYKKRTKDGEPSGRNGVRLRHNLTNST